MQTNRKQISALVAWRWEKGWGGMYNRDIKGHEETSKGNEYVRYLFYADSFADVNAHQNVSNCTL